jgi:hypothetical protein
MMHLRQNILVQKLILVQKDNSIPDAVPYAIDSKQGI